MLSISTGVFLLERESSFYKSWSHKKKKRERIDKVSLIEVVITVCSLAHPDGCMDKHIQFVDQGASLAQCMMQAPVYLAEWSGDHPDEQIKKWRCAYPDKEDQPT